MSLEELKNFEEQDFQDISALLTELSGSPAATRENLESALADPFVHIYVLREDSRIAGCASLCIFDVLSGRKGSVEDVVVLSSCRGRHFGRSLMEYVIAEARRLGLVELQLTSKPHRVAANKLYPSLGFVKVDTNCYRMKFEGDDKESGL